MKILVNETPLEIGGDATAGKIAQEVKPGADLFILNGFPVDGSTRIQTGDSLVLIRRGEIPPMAELETALVSRHSPGVHRRLKQAVVGIAGCGGLGSNVAVALARVGIGTLIIADFDIVEPSNLNRQHYFIDQIGLPKTTALRATLERINPLVRVIEHPVRLDPGNLCGIFQAAEVLVEAFDRADQKAMIIEQFELSMPGKDLIIGLGMAGFGANHLLHTRSVGHLHICGDECSEARQGSGLMAPRVGIVAHMQANQVLEILLSPDRRSPDFPEKGTPRS